VRDCAASSIRRALCTGCNAPSTELTAADGPEPPNAASCAPFPSSGGELLWRSVVRTLFIEAGHELTAESVRTTVEFEGLSRFQEKRIVYELSGPDAPRQKPNGNFAVAAALPTAM